MAYTAQNPVIGAELHDGDFNKGTEAPDRYTVKFDVAGVTPVTKSAAGIAVGFPAVIPATATMAASQLTGPLPASALTLTGAYDAIGNKLTITANGVPTIIPLDPSAGMTASIVGSDLVLKDDQGVVLSATPIAGLDAQTLTVGGTTAAPTLAISNGNVVNLPSSDPTTLAAAFTAGADPIPAGTSLLASDGKKYNLVTISSSFGTPLFKAFAV